MLTADTQAKQKKRVQSQSLSLPTYALQKREGSCPTVGRTARVHAMCMHASRGEGQVAMNKRLQQRLRG